VKTFLFPASRFSVLHASSSLPFLGGLISNSAPGRRNASPSPFFWRFFPSSFFGRRFLFAFFLDYLRTFGRVRPSSALFRFSPFPLCSMPCVDRAFSLLDLFTPGISGGETIKGPVRRGLFCRGLFPGTPPLFSDLFPPCQRRPFSSSSCRGEFLGRETASGEPPFVPLLLW